MLRKFLNFVGDATGILFFAFLFLAALQSYQKTHSVLSFSMVLANSLMLAMYLLRSRPKLLIESPAAWLISLGATLLPFMFRPVHEAWIPALLNMGYSMQIIGLLAIIGALLSLRDSIGIVPANRGIKIGQFYRLIRHPLYASEIFFFTGYVLSNQSIQNLVPLTLILPIQYFRSRLEERLLMDDPMYKQYLSRTRYRFIPGLL